MYYQLGALRLEGTLTASAMDSSSGVSVSEVVTLAGRPVVQRQAGAPLMRRTLRVVLNALLGHDPSGVWGNLSAARDNGEVLPFSDGAGNDLGTYLIAGLTETIIAAGIDGSRIHTEIGIELLEYVDRSPDVTLRRQAVAAGFATDERRIIPVLPTVQGVTVASVTSAQARAAQGQCLDGFSDVQTAVTVPSQKASLFAMAKAKAEAAIENLSAAITTVQDVASIAATAPLLLAQLQAVRTAAQTFSTRLDEGDLTNALASGQLMADAAGGITTAIRPLDLAIITRRPI